MWPEITRPKYERDGLRHTSDPTDAEWAVLAPFAPPAEAPGRPRTTDLREVIGAILYVLRSGCPWRTMPKHFPPRSTVQRYFYAWRRDGFRERIDRTLLAVARVAGAGRPAPQPASATASCSCAMSSPMGPVPAPNSRRR